MSQVSIVLTFVVIILVLGKDLLIPIVLAIFVWFIIREIRQLFDKIRFVREKVPSWIVNLISTLGLFAIIGLVVSIISSNVNLLAQNIDVYERNLRSMVVLINDTFGIDVLSQIKGYQGELNVSKLLTSLINTVTSVFGNVFIILIYILFILIEESGFHRKMDAFYSDKEHRDRSNKILTKIDNSIGQYLFLKTLVSFITAITSFFVLLIIGVNGPFFWAFIIFVLNFIPTIGSLIASVFPAAFALLQFGEIGPALWVLAIVGVIQVIVGNFLEPKIMGNSLNLSGLVVLLSLSVWGAIWGIVGMALSVPITVILLILFAEFPQTRPIAVLLSEKGKLKS
jgi:predicted PurR-regulated permease PerM